MQRDTRIVIVENNLCRAAKLSLQLDQLGYQITGIFSRAKEALSFIKQEAPDLVLLEDRLSGTLNGFESNSKNSAFPVLRFKEEQPAEKLLKKLSQLNFQKRLKKTFKQIKPAQLAPPRAEHFILKDRIFIRDRDKMLRISLMDIQYVEADRNYCRLHTRTRKYLLVTTLKEVDEKLLNSNFLRIHRSFLVNLNHIDEIGKNYVIINSKYIPLSKAVRNELLEHLRVL
ncbi:response regulator transcription factor [Gramella sp. GC03-9]|uniref:Response regulator transcription factor n=1 Tax=Christiangramia oceanisediminis TaxID=2920386 RepID=A0A9X2I5Z3_9FLAO|nr:LytTR family DNA-binding domain-containing protein [Gramella oceanisediminis]MCP9200027.1 response regulator transcription factor [Gramella oceanisediminis]